MLNLLTLSVLFSIVLLLPVTNPDLPNDHSLESKVAELKLLSKRDLIRLNAAKFKEFIKSPPRNYSFIVMLTAMEAHRRCSICGMVYEEFVITVRSFRLAHGYGDDIFFGVVDFDTGGEVFQSLKINTAPVIMHFPPRGKVKSQDTMDMQRVGYNAEVIARWIVDRTGFEFKIVRPPNYLSTIMLFILFGGGLLLLYLRPENLQAFQNKTAWAVISVVFCLLMTSGQMWNHIRNPPFYHRSNTGQTVYIHGSSQGQFVSETYIVFMLNIGFVASVIGVIESSNKKNMFSIVCLIIAALTFSLLLSIFRAKAGGYPYKALF